MPHWKIDDNGENEITVKKVKLNNQQPQIQQQQEQFEQVNAAQKVQKEREENRNKITSDINKPIERGRQQRANLVNLQKVSEDDKLKGSPSDDNSFDQSQMPPQYFQVYQRQQELKKVQQNHDLPQNKIPQEPVETYNQFQRPQQNIYSNTSIVPKVQKKKHTNYTSNLGNGGQIQK